MLQLHDFTAKSSFPCIKSVGIKIANQEIRFFHKLVNVLATLLSVLWTALILAKMACFSSLLTFRKGGAHWGLSRQFIVLSLHGHAHIKGKLFVPATKLSGKVLLLLISSSPALTNLFMCALLTQSYVLSSVIICTDWHQTSFSKYKLIQGQTLVCTS